MEDATFITFTEQQKISYSVFVLNVAWDFYHDGDVESAAGVLGMREDCVGRYFERFGLTGTEENVGFFADDDGKCFAGYWEDFEDDDLYDEIFGECDRLSEYSA